MYEREPNDKFTKWLLSALTIAFVAWAGVVWTAGEKGLALGNEVLIKLVRIESKLEATTSRFERHTALPWHGTVGLELDRLRRAETNK